MLGAIAGDIVGSVYEWDRIKTVNFPLFNKDSTFTDDTVLTIACASSLLNSISYDKSFRFYAKKYPNESYGGIFQQWIFNSEMGPYSSWGNGSAMRVSPVGFAADSIDWALSEAMSSAEVTHNHPEGIKGAQATALAIFLGKNNYSKREIKSELELKFDYNLSRKLDDIRPDYTFDESCQGTVPEAIISFLDSEDFESSIRNAVSLGGDSDTLACIAGGIAEAYYGKIPEEIKQQVYNRVPKEFLKIISEFRSKYCTK